MLQISHDRPGFFASVGRVLRRYADFEGRATRAEFWWYMLFYVLVLSLCNVFAFIELAPGVTVASVLASLFAIVTLLPTLAVGVRRLRDAGLGWGQMWWLLLPFAGPIILAIYWARPTVPALAEEPGRWTL